MILVASAPNDPFNNDLIPLIGGLAVPTPLPYGDIVFFGVWGNHQPIRVCIERKKLYDIVQCILASGRHMQQVQDASTAGFDFIFIIVEGIFRPGPTSGLIEVRSGSKWVPMSQVRIRRGQLPDLEYKRLDDYLNELDLYLSVRSRRSSSPSETAKIAMDLYYLFQRPPEDHTSLRQFYTPPDAYAGFLERPSLLRRVASQFPDIGWVRSRAFEQRFSSLADLCLAILEGDTKALMQVDGIGKTLADRIIDESVNGSEKA